MRPFSQRASAVVIAVALASAGTLTTEVTAAAAPVDRLVDEVPSTATPDIGDGATYDIAQVGDKVIVGGTFTEVADRGSDETLTRHRLLAFDADTGKVDSDFAPEVDGSVVRAVLPGPNDHTVYVGGTFSAVNGTWRRNLALLDTETGEVVDGFDPPSFAGPVKTLRKVGDRLLVGGGFDSAGGTERRGLASVGAQTGELDSYLDVALRGHHNYTGEPGQAKGSVGPRDMEVSPDGETLAVIGNFTTADDLPRDQIVLISLGESSAVVDESWTTAAFEDECNARKFDTYMRGIDYAPDGSYFAVVTSGGYGGPSSVCDATSRFAATATGEVEPEWVEFTGADTLHSVAVTEQAIYVGGHQRWQNNHDGRDEAGPGAVPRPGIAALDPRNGVPLAWNPGRHPRGVGARAMLVTDAGLYVGQDTDYIGKWRYHRGKIAFFPFAGGAQVPAERTGTLPGDVYLAGSDGDPIKRAFDGDQIGQDEDVTGTGSWSGVRGTFMVNDTLYYGVDGDMLRKRQFDGSTFGQVHDIDPYNDPKWSDFPTGSGETYRGQRPDFYAQLSDVTGMLYRDGRLYYTLSTNSGLFWRSFNPVSGVVSNVEHEVSDMARWNVAGGMFLDGDTLYFPSRSTGNLYKTAWADGVPEGALTKVSGPNVDGRDWGTRAMFLLPGE